MPHLVICPSCRHELRVAADTAGGSITCPRCLARLPHPVADTPGWVPLQSPLPGARHLLGYVDAEVRRDSQGTGYGLILLALLAVPGLAGLLTGLLAVQLELNKSLTLVFLGLLGLFLALLISGVVLSYTGGDQAARGIGRMIVGSLAVLGVTILVGGSLALALLVLLFAVCSAIGF